MSVKIISHIALIVFIYYCVYHIYSGIMNPVPSLGDSWDYHIPIAQTILEGSFLSLNTAKLSQWFYPGSGELPLALFMALHLPLTLSNILPIVILFFVLWRFGYPKLEYYYSLFFSLTVVTLNGVIRWMNAVSIDIWVAVFFTSLLILFEHPRKTTLYYLLLGLFSGLLIGSKYPGLILLLILVVVYHQSILRSISLKRLGVFLIPFSIFGLFWYGRNYVMTGNPIYPLPLFSLPSVPLFSTRVIDVLLTRPIEFMNAFFAEYKVWSLLILLIPFILLIKKHVIDQSVIRLLLVGLLSGLVFLLMPTSFDEWIMVSSFRYFLPSGIVFMYLVFYLAKKYGVEMWVGYVSIASMIFVTSLGYYPKLVLVSLPLSLIAIYYIDKFLLEQPRS